MPKRRSKLELLAEEQVVLSEERTLLSRERTILSFMQTGLAFIGIGLVVVNVFSELNTQIVGWCLVVVGVVEVAESIRRIIRYRHAMSALRARKAKIIKETGI